MKTALQLAQPIKDAVDAIVFDKAIPRPLLIEALEEAAADIKDVMDSLRDDERRAPTRANNQ